MANEMSFNIISYRRNEKKKKKTKPFNDMK